MSQIAVWRGLESPQIGYWHHGVLLPDGSVIHYSGVKSGKRHARIRRTSAREFAKGRAVYAVVQDSLPAREVAARAESRLGESGYNLLFNNCETFASWCVTGKDVSRQSLGVARGIREGIRSEGGWVGGVLGGFLAGMLLQGSIRHEVRRIA